MDIVFYDPAAVKAASRSFTFGKPGVYYEYILFFDQVSGLNPGMYRYAVFMGDRLLYEGRLEIGLPQ